MQAVWYRSNGAARDVLEQVALPIPEPRPGEVRVRLAFSGINPSDVKSRAGSRPVVSEYVIPHSDGAGVIDAVGPGVPVERIGQPVWVWNAQYGRRDGTAAEYVALPGEQAVSLPDGVSLAEGAALGIPALTAAHAVTLAGLGTGRTVLITGGASNVGFYAAQFARRLGARVLATIGSEERATWLKAHGINDLIYYKDEPVAARVLELTAGRGVDAVIDLDFSSNSGLIEQGALAQFGQYVCYGSHQRGDVPVHYASCLQKAISLHFFLVYTLSSQQRENAIALVQDGLATSQLAHHDTRIFPLSEIIAAHECVESGAFMGKVLIAFS